MKYYTNVVCPDYSPEIEDINEIVAAFNSALLSYKKPFIEVNQPENGDVVVFKSRFIAHTGLVFDKKVLHNHPNNGSVCLESLWTVMRKYKSTQFFRHVSRVEFTK
jgi:hypothetical protein